MSSSPKAQFTLPAVAAVVVVLVALRTATGGDPIGAQDLARSTQPTPYSADHSRIAGAPADEVPPSF